jgi:RNA polymerase sigma-70 factor, ECF subfamily
MQDRTCKSSRKSSWSNQDVFFEPPVLNGDDDELVREFRSGSAQALGVIFDRYHRLVLATAWRVLRDVGEAEDLTQSVFLEISRKAAQFDPAKGPLNKWILTLAYHRSLNRKSYLITRQFYNGHVDLIGENGEELWSTSFMRPSQEAARLANECLGLLDPRQRQVMELVFFKELTFKEIAEQTQQTFGNVRNQYYRALKRLRVHLSASSREDRRQALTVFEGVGTAASQGEVQFDSGAFADETVPGGEARLGHLKMSSS